jgi:hypothetical protein
MADAFETQLTIFLEELNRIQGLTELLDGLREFGRITPPYASSDSDFIVKVRNLKQDIRERHTSFPVLSATLVLYLVGRFEKFARSNFEIVCDSIAGKCAKFENLPERMRKELKKCTADVISNYSRYGFEDYEVHILISRLSNNLLAVNGLGEINSNCLSLTHENMRPRALADLYQRSGLSEIWIKIGNQAVMQDYFDSKIGGSVQKHAMALLENIINERNGIAHPTPDITFPGTDKVKRYAEFLEVLSIALVEISRQYVSDFTPIVN